MYIPIFVSYAGFLISIVLTLIFKRDLFINRICGAAILFLIFTLVRFLTRRKLGLGDIHYSLYCGFLSGVPNFIFAAFISALLAMIFLLSKKITCRNNDILTMRLPFTPFMFLGCIISLFIPDFL